jgi:hypothetical protein
VVVRAVKAVILLIYKEVKALYALSGPELIDRSQVQIREMFNGTLHTN